VAIFSRFYDSNDVKSLNTPTVFAVVHGVVASFALLPKHEKREIKHNKYECVSAFIPQTESVSHAGI
jgi:hypothetical protein